MDNLRQIKIQDATDATRKATVDSLGNISVRTEDAEINKEILKQIKLTNMYLSEIAGMVLTDRDIDN